MDIKIETLLRLSFYVISGIIFSNINGFMFGLFGIQSPFSIVILIGCLIISYYLFRYERLTLPHHFLNLSIASYLIIGGISWFFYSHLHHEDIDYYGILRKQIPSFLLVYTFYKYTLYEGHKYGLNGMLTFITIFLFLIALTVPFGEQIGLRGMVDYMGNDRESGVFRNPNKAGAHINYTLVLMLFLIMENRRNFLFWLFLGFLPIMFYASLTTFSKATLIVSGLILLSFLWINIANFLKLGKRRRFRFTVIIASVILAIGFAKVQFAGYIVQLQGSQLNRILAVRTIVTTGELNSKTTTHRSDVWMEGFYAIAEHPIIGNGFGSFNRLPRNEFGIHNVYLMFFGEAGIFSFLLLLLFSFLILYRSMFWPRSSSYRFLAISLCAVTFIQIFNSGHTGIRTSEPLAMIGILLAVIEVVKKEGLHRDKKRFVLFHKRK